MNQEKSTHLEKRDFMFLFLSGVFITSLILGNIIGTTKFVTLFTINLPDWSLNLVPEIVRNDKVYSMIVPAGLIAYPFTFLATDLICELFGEKRAQSLVIVGFMMNMFMLLLMSINHWLPNSFGVSAGNDLFEGVYGFMISNVIASMIAYLIAQSIDVRLFHFWKKLTKGKHLWLRNNASTMVSQLFDSLAIISILYASGNLGNKINSLTAVLILVFNSYIFKFFFALFDTPLFYLGVKVLENYNEDKITE